LIISALPLLLPLLLLLRSVDGGDAADHGQVHVCAQQRHAQGSLDTLR
jgi:hypothetical protein